MSLAQLVKRLQHRGQVMNVATVVTAAHEPAPAVQRTFNEMSTTVQREPRTKAELDESWRVLDAAYLAHHFACKTCIAAGQGRGLRCGTGAALWVNYQEAAMTPTKIKSTP